MNHGTNDSTLLRKNSIEQSAACTYVNKNHSAILKFLLLSQLMGYPSAQASQIESLIISANQRPFRDFPEIMLLLMRFFVLVLENEIFVIMLKHFPLYKRQKFLNILKISILEILKIKLRSIVFLFTFHFTFQLLRTWLLLKKSKNFESGFNWNYEIS